MSKVFTNENGDGVLYPVPVGLVFRTRRLTGNGLRQYRVIFAVHDLNGRGKRVGGSGRGQLNLDNRVGDVFGVGIVRDQKATSTENPKYSLTLHTISADAAPAMPDWSPTAV